MKAPRSSWQSALWVVLMVLVAIPLPFRGLVMPERGAPILYLIVAAALVLFLGLARVSLPFAVLLGYAMGHVLAAGYPMRGVQLLLLMAMCGVLYVEAANLDQRWAERAGWALLAGGTIEGALGILNLFHIFPSPIAAVLPLRYVGVEPEAVFRWFNSAPWLTLLSRDYLGRTMGWLTHPNYWGSYMALMVPVAYALLGRWAGLGAFGFVLLSGSIWAVVSGAVGLLFMAWRDVPRVVRPAVVAGLLVATLTVSAWHIAPRLDAWGPAGQRKALSLETLTSGRTVVWAEAFEKVKESPILGHGLGSWRMWAGEVNRVSRSQRATLQAHSEGLQMIFELGLVGLAIAIWWLIMLARRGRGSIVKWNPRHVMWAGVLVVAVVNSFGSPTFHLPTQAAVTLFAAARIEGDGRGL